MEQHNLDELHTKFLAILPRIELHGRIYFRHLNPHNKADAIQEMCSLAWKWLLRLDEQGKDPADFLMSFTTFLARAVNSGRRGRRRLWSSTISGVFRTQDSCRRIRGAGLC